MRLFRRTLIALLLLASAPAKAFSDAEEAAYRIFFSAATLGAAASSPSLLTGWTLHYRGALPYAAFAFAHDPATGRAAWGFAGGRATADAAAEAALDGCRRQLGALPAPCRLFAQDGALVSGALAPVPLAMGTLGPFRRSPLHFARGAAAARGAVIWGHGYAGPDHDNRVNPVPGIVSVLNDAGWDVLRFDRHPGDDTLSTSLPRLIAGIETLRAAGYRRIVAGGQSRGGWQAIMAAGERPELIEAVVATAPAAHGEWRGNNTLGAALDDFRRLVAGLGPLGPRVLVALFDGDAFDPDPARRAAMVAALAEARPAPLLTLWPREDIRGHGGASDWRFTRFFGACVLTLVQAPAAGAPRGLRRDPCGGG
jgi:pimeloyl-ACP methyl ester carboxylesterase